MTDSLTNLEKAALLSGRNTWQTRPVPRFGIESMFLADGPHGVRKQVGEADQLGLHPSYRATCFPTAATLANSWDPGLAHRVGAALGAEAAWQEVDVLLGPGLNIKRSPLGGRNFEYYSEDPYLAGKLAAAYVRGIQSAGVAATPKHFAANNQELRRMASDSVVDERTLREIYLTAFEIVVREAGPLALMTSYNMVNGSYANENRHLLTDILRDEWGFDGMVVSDWGGGNDVVAGAAAGGGVEMPAPGHDSTRRLVDAVAEGRLTQASLDARAAEVVRLARRSAGIEHPMADLAASHAIAREAAAASIVLLRNENSLLPLQAGTQVALIGDLAETPRFQGAGSSQVNAIKVVQPLAAFSSSPLEVVGFAPGYRRFRASNAAMIAEAAELAGRADVAVVFIGLDESSEAEGVDRSHLDLPAAQLEVLAAVHAANPATVVVLTAGSVVNTDWVDQAEAIVHAYLPGQAGAEAVVDVLTGQVNPSGRLAESYPLSLADTPTAGRFPAPELHSYYLEGPFVGYRHYLSAAIEVRYPFGFGLGYSKFEYSDLVVDDLGVEFTLTNTSDRDGAEVAQLYVGLPDSKVIRPVRELKGFSKQFLEAGQSRRVRMDFDEYTWRHFDVVTGQWQTEPGSWQIMVAANCADIRLTASIDKAGPVVARDPKLASYAAGDGRKVTVADFTALLGRPLPRPQPSDQLHINDPLLELARAPSPIGRLVNRRLAARLRRSQADGMPGTEVVFVRNMPFRAIAKLSSGAVSIDMVEGLVDLFNGHHLRGMLAVLRGYRRNKRDNARVDAMLTSGPPYR